MTSATERLRALLDERGVEHYDGIESTLWLKDEHGYRASADEVSGGMMRLHVWCTSPEQAVAATLGPGTCEDVTSEDRTQAFTCSECGCWVAYDEYWETGIYVDGDGQAVHIHPRYCPNCGRRVVE